ncbi:2'-5' RNA ligase family protein [Haladaptatus sp. AB643]|uniref:2'-5' RNA ligase family protein n=1 Tax=unclassified Haladaptatus TaxID=2622732 RepID=UPI00209C1157|nr:2'-5' RNA ligase family protein [Haladaptatus sp. AB643]MCO8252618.1 2'-5' RNA ligase family protein [Haladaptatus sp. AB618]
MYSLNVPVPGEIAQLAGQLRPSLYGFDSVRDQHTLVVKRFGDQENYDRLAMRVRTALVGTPAFEAHVSGIDYFETPARGDGPVVYLAVESPGLKQLHSELLAEFETIEGLEGDDYVPHVTLARGGDIEVAQELAERETDPISWTVTELHLWDAKYEEAAARISLPA